MSQGRREGERGDRCCCHCRGGAAGCGGPWRLPHLSRRLAAVTTPVAVPHAPSATVDQGHWSISGHRAQKEGTGALTDSLGGIGHGLKRADPSAREGHIRQAASSERFRAHLTPEAPLLTFKNHVKDTCVIVKWISSFPLRNHGNTPMGEIAFRHRTQEGTS